MTKIDNETPIKSISSPLARGKRVALLRRLTGLSRRIMHDKYGIPKTTLQNWEEGKGSGLSDKGAHKLISLLKADGIISSYEWLMFGLGKWPIVVEGSPYALPQNIQNPSHLIEEQDQFITEELQLFHQHYPHSAIDYMVADDAMEPRFIKNEYVAGIRHHGQLIENLIGLDCIVQTSDGDLLLRHIKKRELNGLYILSCSNMNTIIDKPILYDIELIMAAPVIWARRKNRF